MSQVAQKLHPSSLAEDEDWPVMSKPKWRRSQWPRSHVTSSLSLFVKPLQEGRNCKFKKKKAYIFSKHMSSTGKNTYSPFNEKYIFSSRYVHNSSTQISKRYQVWDSTKISFPLNDDGSSPGCANHCLVNTGDTHSRAARPAHQAGKTKRRQIHVSWHACEPFGLETALRRVSTLHQLLPQSHSCQRGPHVELLLAFYENGEVPHPLHSAVVHALCNLVSWSLKIKDAYALVGHTVTFNRWL